MWITQPLQLRDSLKWRMTATSDEDGGGPWGNPECFHDTAEAAQACEKCDEYVSGVTGFPSRRARAEQQRQRDMREIERLQHAYPDKF